MNLFRILRDIFIDPEESVIPVFLPKRLTEHYRIEL